MGKRSALLAMLPIGLCILTVLHAQDPAPTRDPNRTAQSTAGLIRGRILAADTGQPLGRAQVTLGGPAVQPPRRALTDAEGRYEFMNVPAGSFSVSASKTGYVNLQYGQRRPFEPGRPVAVTAGQTVDRIDVALPRGAVIAVRVTDDLGYAISGVQVRAQRFQYHADGQRTLTGVFGGPGPMQTDDRGDLRLFGLMPGEYVVSAVAPGAAFTDASATGEGYAPTFYPGVISASQAAAVSVRLGEEIAVQFAMVRARLARISGVVVDSQGRPANGARVWLATSSPAVTAGASAGADGRFEIANVAPGEYGLLVTFDAIEEVAAKLTVDGLDMSDLRVVVGSGTTVSGRVVYDGGSPPAGGASPFRVVLASVDRPSLPGVMPNQRAAAPDVDGRFGFTGVSGRVLVDITSPEGWMMKSVSIDGQDVTGTALDLGRRPALSNVVITVTNRLTTVSGQVTDAGASPVRDAVVVIVPAEAQETAVMNRRVRTIRSGPGGAFQGRAMMPGRYVAVAVEALEEGRQFSPELHQQVRRVGQEFDLREGATATINLRLSPDL